jgi:hypothetical protein
MSIVFILISILNLCNTQPPTLQTDHQEKSHYHLSHAPSKKQRISLVVASKLQKDWLDNPQQNLQDKALHLSPQQSGISCAKNLQGLGPDATWTMPTLVNNSARMTTQTHKVSDSQPATAPIIRTQCSVKKTAAELKGINEIRHLNKKKIDAKRKKEEEELKHKEDEEEALKKAEEEKAKAKVIEEDSIAKNLHSIMNGIDRDEDLWKSTATRMTTRMSNPLQTREAVQAKCPQDVPPTRHTRLYPLKKTKTKLKRHRQY